MRVRLRELDVSPRLRQVTLIELEGRELQLALRRGELARRTTNGAVALRLTDDRIERRDLSGELGCARATEQRGEGEQDRASHRPAPRCASRLNSMALSA